MIYSSRPYDIKKIKTLSAKYIQLYKKEEWETFGNYIDWLDKIIRVDVNATDWLFSKCSCSFLKKITFVPIW